MIMSKTSEIPVADKAIHLAWCALMALHIARQDGSVCSESQENIFLTRWLSEASRQKRFARELAPDIGWLLKQGREQGVRARLRHKFEYIWQSGTRAIAGQSDLFRLTLALETAKDSGWHYRLLADREWEGRHAVRLAPGISGIHILRSGLSYGFNDNGSQIHPIPVKISGNTEALQLLLEQCHWKIAGSEGNQVLRAVREDNA